MDSLSNVSLARSEEPSLRAPSLVSNASGSSASKDPSGQDVLPGKRCTKCASVRLLHEFHLRACSPDGHHPVCKRCREVYAHAWNQNKSSFGAQDVRLGLASGVDHKAHARLHKMVRCGFVVRPKTCQRCGIYGVRILAHHEDYTRAHDVVWLCDTCHRWIHVLRVAPMRNEWEMPLSVEPGLEAYRNFRHRSDAAHKDEAPNYSRLYAALDSLSHREREIIRLRFDEGYILEEIGRRFNITRERVRQIEHRVLHKLSQMILESV